MHKMAERPIEVRRVIFSEVPTLHDGPAHNTRSVSRVTDISHVFVIIYVDDMLLSDRHTGELTELVRKLRLKFAMKDLGPARHMYLE